MTAKIITIAQQKGGAGKTTLIVHLATFWSGQGLSVAVADIDPQGSVTQWAKLRAEKQGRAAPFVLPVTGWRTAAEVERLAKTYDIVLIDSPPHAATEARIAVRAAHQVLIPLQPSVLDLWATKATLDLAAEEKRPAQLVLNRVPPRGKASATARHSRPRWRRAWGFRSSRQPGWPRRKSRRWPGRSIVCHRHGICPNSPQGRAGSSPAVGTPVLETILCYRPKQARYVPHFAAWPGLDFPVEVQLGVRVFQDFQPSVNLVANEILHRAIGQAFG
jgi:molybdopterin-guanine dinucleotide biosynthesis protein